MGKHRNRKAKRDTSVVSNPTPSLNKLLSPVLTPLTPIASHRPKNLKTVEDRRSWHPEGVQAPAKSLHKPRHRLTLKAAKPVQGVRSTPARTATVGATIGFTAPKKVLICIRRKMRKEVLFALRKTGKGAKARKHRRSYYSSIRC